MYEISKSDWKLFREKIGDWQENYMQRLEQEYISLLSDDGKLASDKFWELEKRIKKDKKSSGVILQMSKSEAIWNIANMIKLKVIALEDLEDFSDNLKEAVTLMLDRG